MMAGRCQGGGRHVGGRLSTCRTAPGTPGIPGDRLNEDGRHGGRACAWRFPAWGTVGPRRANGASGFHLGASAGSRRIATARRMDRAADLRVHFDCRACPEARPGPTPWPFSAGWATLQWRSPTIHARLFSWIVRETAPPGTRDRAGPAVGRPLPCWTERIWCCSMGCEAEAAPIARRGTTTDNRWGQ